MFTMKILIKIWKQIYGPVERYRNKRRLDKRLAEMRKRDPFIY